MGASQEELLATLQKERNGFISAMSSTVDIENSTEYRVIIQVLADTSVEYRSEQAVFGKEVAVYLVSSAVIAGITVNNIYLTFYKGKLIRFYTPDARDLGDAIAAKYGAGTTTKSYKPIICTYKLTGRKVSEQEGSTIAVWHSGNVKTVRYTGNKFDFNCKEQDVRYLTITAQKEYAEALAASKVLAAARDKKQAQREAAKLKGL